MSRINRKNLFQSNDVENKKNFESVNYEKIYKEHNNYNLPYNAKDFYNLSQKDKKDIVLDAKQKQLNLLKNLSEISGNNNPVIEEIKVTKSNIIEDDIDEELTYTSEEDNDEEIDLYDSEPENYIIYEHPNYNYDKENDDFYDALNELVEEVYDSYDNIVDVNNGVVLRIHKKNEEFFSHLLKPKMINREIQTENIENVKSQNESQSENKINLYEDNKEIIQDIKECENEFESNENGFENNHKFDTKSETQSHQFIFTKYFDDETKNYLESIINNEKLLYKFLNDYGTDLYNTADMDFLMFQLERNPKTKNLHLQGFFHLKKRVRLSTMSKNKEYAWAQQYGFWKKRMIKSYESCYNYCSKLNTKIMGPLKWGQWKEKNIRHDLKEFINKIEENKGKLTLELKKEFVYAKYSNYFDNLSLDIQEKIELDNIKKKVENIKLNKFQLSTINYSTEQDGREILWIYNPDGKIGKSELIKYLKCMNPDDVFVCLDDETKNIMESYKNEKLVLCNLSKSIENINYGIFEKFKDGIIQKSKYKSKTYYVDDIKVIVFSNEKPDFEKLIEDRWHVIEIDAINEKIIDHYHEKNNHYLDTDKFEIIKIKFDKKNFNNNKMSEKKISDELRRILQMNGEIKIGKNKIYLDNKQNIQFKEE